MYIVAERRWKCVHNRTISAQYPQSKSDYNAVLNFRNSYVIWHSKKYSGRYKAISYRRFIVRRLADFNNFLIYDRRVTTYQMDLKIENLVNRQLYVF